MYTITIENEVGVCLVWETSEEHTAEVIASNIEGILGPPDCVDA